MSSVTYEMIALAFLKQRFLKQRYEMIALAFSLSLYTVQGRIYTLPSLFFGSQLFL